MGANTDRIEQRRRWRGRPSAGTTGRAAPPPGGLRMNSTGMGDPEAAVEADLVALPRAPALQDGEIVLLAIRPSRWLLVAHLAGSLALVALALGLGVRGFGGATTARGMAVAAGLAVVAWLPVGAWFAMDWRSHRYVLTNRRVIASVGLVRPFVAEAPLAAVHRVVLDRSLVERALGIGTVRFINPHAIEVARWSLVARPGGVRSTVLEALHRYGRGDVEEE